MFIKIYKVLNDYGDGRHQTLHHLVPSDSLPPLNVILPDIQPLQMSEHSGRMIAVGAELP